MNKKLIQLLTLTALLIGASAHAMDTPEELGLQLRQAAKEGNLVRMGELLQQGAPVDAKDSWGQTPLMIAARYGRINVCKLLLDHGALVDANDYFDRGPLSVAANSGHTDTCHFLIDTIVTQIKNNKANAIVLLGLRNRGKISYLNPIDKNVIRLIARKVVYDSAPSREKQRQSLFAQIDSNRCDAPWITKLKEELRAYPHEKL